MAPKHEGPQDEGSPEGDLKNHIRALLTERGFYKARGESTDAVDAELKRLGHKGSAPQKRATTRGKK